MIYIPIEIYDAGVLFSTNKEDFEKKNFKKILKKHGIYREKDFDGIVNYITDYIDNNDFMAVTIYRMNKVPIIYFPKIETYDKVKRCGTIAHEALHSISFIKGEIGVTFSSDSEESYAYGMTHILENILKNTKEWNS